MRKDEDDEELTKRILKNEKEKDEEQIKPKMKENEKLKKNEKERNEKRIGLIFKLKPTYQKVVYDHNTCHRTLYMGQGQQCPQDWYDRKCGTCVQLDWTFFCGLGGRIFVAAQLRREHSKMKGRPKKDQLVV